MGDHHIVVVPLTALALVLLGAVGPEVHRGRVVPKEKRLSFVVDLVDEVQRMLGYLFIDGFPCAS
jgi:hypothetical protein